MERFEKHLLKELDTFIAFARNRIGDPHLAADAVQDSLLKAVQAAGQLRDEESVTAWFYRILRRTIIDLYRRRDAARRAMESYERELPASGDNETERVACDCVEALIPALNPEYAKLIRALDLEGRPADEIARDQGISANNLRVRHHRARQQLRDRLMETCRVCATHGCLDCTCDAKRV